ncbi:DUF2309 domain-containing protein [Tautonia sp. JC769]|uniref:DUF2309 domain-containing protein n=1 Tax=Tautonia sp. JC769 TaxID=3232135 RepID=UPI0034574CD9
MQDGRTLRADRRRPGDEGTPTDRLEDQVEHAAHVLPSQGPITVFVHHNPLHAFEGLPFDEALGAASALYGCHPYLPEDHYRAEVDRGRIGRRDLAEVLMEDLGEDADLLIGFMGTRYHLRLAMLEHPLRTGTDAEIRWLVTGSDALKRFRSETPPDVRRRMIDQTRDWALRASREGRSGGEGGEALTRLLGQVRGSRVGRWDDRVWEAFTLRLLWRVCHAGVHGVKRLGDPPPGSSVSSAAPVRHRDFLLLATGRDTDRLVHGQLITFLSAFLDQGLAAWMMPGRSLGLFRGFVGLYKDARPVEPWLRGLPGLLREIDRSGQSAIGSLESSLAELGVADPEREAFLSATLLALPGWFGMIRQLETNAEWAVHPAPPGTLREALAVRLLLERLALGHEAREALGRPPRLETMRHELHHRIPQAPRVSVDQRTSLVFQLAQVRGWSPSDLDRLSGVEWSRLVGEIEGFGSLARRRVYHRAFERRYRHQALDALASHADRVRAGGEVDRRRPEVQVITCIDDREESFRRHLEEQGPEVETFGAAGFFGVAMYYRGVGDAHYRPLCPVVVKPRHYVREQAAYSLTGGSRQRAETRRLLGTALRHWHQGSRGLLGGIATAMLGSLASVPLLTRILLPRLTARINRQTVGFVAFPPVTELTIRRLSDPPGPEEDHLGFSDAEMAEMVLRLLQDIGLTGGFAGLVVVIGHGSSSLNNPHESAYNCGACSGGLGGANARSFALMANDARVRAILDDRGMSIPEGTVFVGAFHDTSTEDVIFYDLDRIPTAHRRAFERFRERIDLARGRNAHERCRRFESADLGLSLAEALEHVETRADDLSQVRPEYNHATNALCLVGRRAWSRGLFLDRRAFLASYDPGGDDDEQTILRRILQAVIPVCSGINLEYYFSRVDPAGYGCGSKLPHNITSMLGVMEGAQSDLRPGLSQQMVEIHEPMRILFVIEATPDALELIMDRVEAIGRLVRNGWVQMATISPNGRRLHVYRDGRFAPYAPESGELAEAGSSLDWYQGRREALGFASIAPRGGR